LTLWFHINKGSSGLETLLQV